MTGELPSEAYTREIMRLRQIYGQHWTEAREGGFELGWDARERFENERNAVEKPGIAETTGTTGAI